MFINKIPMKTLIPIVLLLLAQMCCWVFSGRTTRRPAVVSGSGGGNPSMEKLISERIKATPKAQMAQYQTQAAKRLQSNLAREIQVLAKNDKRIPSNVRNSAKVVLKKLQAGQLTPALSKALPTILVTNPQQGNAGQQLGSALQGVLPYAPQGTSSPLQVLLQYVKENLNSVTNMLLGTLNGVPQLLQGVVGSLVGNLGGLNDTLGGTLDSVGTLVGGLLG